MTFKETMFFLSFYIFFLLFSHWLLLIIILSHNQAIAFPTLQYFLLIFFFKYACYECMLECVGTCL